MAKTELVRFVMMCEASFLIMFLVAFVCLNVAASFDNRGVYCCLSASSSCVSYDSCLESVKRVAK